MINASAKHISCRKFCISACWQQPVHNYLGMLPIKPCGLFQTMNWH